MAQCRDAIVEVDGNTLTIEGFEFEDCYTEDDIYEEIVDYVLGNIYIEVVDGRY